MNDWMVALIIFAAVAFAMLGQGWASWLEHKRRSQAMDVIKAAIESGREPPPAMYAQIEDAGRSKPPWGEVVVFTALAFGFWIAFSQAEGDQRFAFLVVAATMTVTALGCLGIALMRPGGRRGADDAE